MSTEVTRVEFENEVMAETLRTSSRGSGSELDTDSEIQRKSPFEIVESTSTENPQLISGAIQSWLKRDESEND